MNWTRQTGTFCAAAGLILAALFSVSTSGIAASKFATAKHHSKNSIITESEISWNQQTRDQYQPRWIEVNLSQQRLKAWKGDELVYSMPISSGKDSTPTVTGTFSINSKYRSARMQGRNYDVPNVPYTMYFHNGYAIHGAYWNHNIGTPVSHGCVNLTVAQARKLYEWANVGTLVEIHR